MNTRATEEEELDELHLSDSQMRVLEAIMKRKSIFYTGAAGTGKSFILKIVQQVFHYVKKANALSITATTGIAAVNVRGMTIHSWSGVGIGTGSLEETVTRASRSKAVKKRWEETETLVIDEVSMLSAELFEKISAIGKRCRADPRPFGGLQVIFIGDFFQLPPIFTKPKDFVDCKNTICSQGFAFNSCVWNSMQLEVIGDLYSLTHSVSQPLA
jgi:ATP-dependent DNA helicase PIF1